MKYLNNFKFFKTNMIREEYNVNIDFDEASKAWMINKKKIGDGSYTYVCGITTKQGKPCQNKPMKGKCKCSVHKKYKSNIYQNERDF